MKNKILGLADPFSAPNYGTLLQAYALQKALKDYGVNSEYINYSSRKFLLFKKQLSCIKQRIIYLIKGRKRRNIKDIDDLSFFNTRDFKTVNDGFSSFENKYIISSRRFYNSETIANCKRYAAYMVGSDQSWSKVTIGNCDFFLLKQISSDYPKYSYAPSIGTTHINEEYLKELTSWLDKFKFLSCREKTNCEVLSRRLNRNVQYVLDPTLLLTPREWNKISEPVSLPSKEYILCYILGEKDTTAEFAEKLGAEKELPVYYILTRPKYLSKSNVLRPTPGQFVSLIRDAASVVTDSFHGSIFSINFSTQFYSFTKRAVLADMTNDNDRIMEILNELNLQNRYKEGMPIKFEDDIDYSKVQVSLNQLRTESQNYLKTVVDDFDKLGIN